MLGRSWLLPNAEKQSVLAMDCDEVSGAVTTMLWQTDTAVM